MEVYKKYVNIIKEVTNMQDTLVVFAEGSNRLITSANASWCGFEDKVLPKGFQLENEPMFEFSDFLEDKHVEYYHVELPKKLFTRADKKSYINILKKMFSKVDVPVSLLSIELFIILHEFGHVHFLKEECKGNITEYLNATRERNVILYEIINYDSTEKGREKYRLIPEEKYADDFALKYLKETLEKVTLKRRENYVCKLFRRRWNKN